jgi:hypothetical protein
MGRADYGASAAIASAIGVSPDSKSKLAPAVAVVARTAAMVAATSARGIWRRRGDQPGSRLVGQAARPDDREGQAALGELLVG